MLESIILGFLMRQNATGYDLKQSMSQTTSYFFDASYGSIYPALKRMEVKGLIRSREEVNGGKFKKSYSITDEGRAHFLEWLKQPVRFSGTRHDHLVPLFFYEYLDSETARRNLEQFITEVTLCLNELECQKQKITSQCAESIMTYPHSVLCYGIQYYEMLIRWCTDLTENATSMKPETHFLSESAKGEKNYENYHS